MLSIKLAVQKSVIFICDVLCLAGVLLLMLPTLSAAADVSALLKINRLLIIAYFIINVFIFLLVKCYDEQIRDYSLLSAIKL